MFDRWRQRFANWLAPKRRIATRMYHAARPSRLTTGWGQSETSADAELQSSLRTLRSRTRALVRDAAYAKRAKLVVINNVIGSGIGIQAQVKTSRDQLNIRVNDAIEQTWLDWCDAEHCHTGGSLHFHDLERAVMGQVFDTGECFIRYHFSAFGGSAVPLALELIEPERLADRFHPFGASRRALIRMGVEVDGFYRPLAYWITTTHPGDLLKTPEETAQVERVPAEFMVHLRIVDRWPQTRGEPWLHAAARRLNDMDGYSEAEIVAARGAASYMGTIETKDDNYAGSVETETGERQMELEPGVVEHLKPGEKFEFHSPNRPNSAMDAFMRMMLREVAAGASVSYESLSRDYSQSNYSSSRLALLDDRDLWRVLQRWFIRGFRQRTHRIWMQQAVLARAIPGINVEEYGVNPAKFHAVSYKPRGWSWIDPTKEVEAFKEAIRAGFTTVTEVIAQTGGGRDLEEVLNERERELEMMAEKGLKTDTDPGSSQTQETAETPGDGDEPEDPEDEDLDDDGSGDDEQDRVRRLPIAQVSGGNAW